MVPRFPSLFASEDGDAPEPATDALSALATRMVQTARDSGPLWTTALALEQLLPVNLRHRWRPTHVGSAQLADQLRAIFCAWGMRPSDAETTASLMLYADLRGIDSHGCGMMRAYHRDLKAGLLDPAATATVVRETENTALVDGGGGLGHVPAKLAMEMAIDKCRRHGVAAIAVRRSGHFGAAGAYAEIATAQGLIGVATTSTRAPALVPTFASQALLGTNPIALAAPAAGQPPFLLDMATSTVPIGKLVMAWRHGKSIPLGWATGARGRPLRNASVAARMRRLSPLGGTATMGSHKGYGLAVAVEILSRLLPGAASRDRGRGSEGEIGHFVLAMDPERFCGAACFQEGLGQLIDALRGAERADLAQPVMVAGDPERAALASRSREGIPLTRSVVEDIRTVARASKVPFFLGDRV